MYWLADILLVFFLGLLLYRGIKNGFMTSTMGFLATILDLVLGIGSAFAIAFFVFPLLGWIQDFSIGLIDFAGSFASILKLLNMQDTITTQQLAEYLAIGISTLVLIAPMYFFWRWIDSLFQRLFAWIRKKSGFFRVLGSILGGLCNFAFGAAIVLGVFWAFASIDGSGVFTFANDVLRSGYITGIIYEHNPLYQFLGEPGCFAETFGNLIHGNF